LALNTVTTVIARVRDNVQEIVDWLNTTFFPSTNPTDGYVLTASGTGTVAWEAIPVHDAAVVTYTPTTAADWDSSADPGDVDNALDQLAERVKDVELTAPFLFSDVTLGSDTATIDFTSIPATYKHLRLIAFLRSAKAAVNVDALILVVNNDTTSGRYFLQHIEAANTTVSAYEDVTTNTSFYMGDIPAATSPANLFGTLILDIPNYSGTIGMKTMSVSILGPRDVTTGTIYLQTSGGIYNQTAAINRLTLSALGGDLLTGCVASLYGIP